MTRALVVNAYDVGNWGDAAIVEAVIASVRNAGFDHVTVAPVDWAEGPQGWQALGADDVVPPLVSLRDAPRWARRPRPLRLVHDVGRVARFRLGLRPDAAMAAYRAADVVVSAGGGYLGGSKPGGNLIKAANIRAGVMAGRPTVVAPVTINPWSDPVRRIIRWGLAGSTVFVRDAPTLDLVTGADVRAVLVPDIAVRAPSLLQAHAERPGHPVDGGARVIGWAPRGYRADHAAWGQPGTAESTVLDAVRDLIHTSGRSLRLVPHVRAGAGDDDLDAVQRLMDRFTPAERSCVSIAERPDTLAAAVRQYADLDVLITSRMHAAIFAMAVGTPAIAVAYEPKVGGVMTDLGLADRVIPADATLSASDVIDLVARLGSAVERERTLAAFERAGMRFAPLDAALADAAMRARS